MKQYMKKQNFSKLKVISDGKYCKKVSFGTKKIADDYIDKLQKESTRDKVPVNSYLCTKCNCWHLTSWEQVDINKFVKDFNAKVDEFIDEYNDNFNADVKNLSEVANILEEALIERNNAMFENYKLKHELEKLKKKYEE